MATIKDVAQRAGVSVSTVSNVINHKPSVNKNLVLKVQQAMEELHYAHNILASSLRNNNVVLIGVVVPRLDSVYSQMIEGLMTSLEGFKAQIILKKTDDFINIQQKALEDLLGLGVKGIAIVNCDSITNDIFSRLQMSGIPLVFLDRGADERYSSVTFDNTETIFQLTRQLQESNKKRPLLIIGPLDFSAENDCLSGYQQALSDSNQTSDWISVPLNKQQAFKELLSYIEHSSHLPDCVIASNSVVATTFREINSLLNLSIPVYELAGDDWQSLRDQAQHIRIHRSALSCGESAGKILMEAIQSKKYQPKHISIHPNPNYRQPVRIHKTDSPDAIRVLLVDGLTSLSIQQLTPNFTKNHGVKVEYTVCEDHQELYDECCAMGKQKSSKYDVIMLDYLWRDNFSHANYILNLSDLWEDSEQYFNSFIKNAANSQYSIPIAIGSQMLLYRKDIFTDPDIIREYYEQTGLHLSLPSTWSSFNTAARFFTRKYNPTSPTEYGTCLMGYNPHGLVEEFLPRFWAYKGSIFHHGKPNFYSPAGKNALNNIKESYRYSYPDISTFIETQQLAEFAKGNVAMVNAFSIHIPSKYNVQMERLVSNLGICPLPGNQMMLGKWELAINYNSRKKELAAEYIRWITNDNISIHSSIIGGFVPKKNVLYDKELDSIYLWKSDIEQYLENCRDMLNEQNDVHSKVWMNDIYQCIGQNLANSIYNNIPVAKSLIQMDSDLAKLL